MSRVAHNGGFFDSRSYVLLEAVLTELHAGDLSDAAVQVEHWLARHAVLVFRSEVVGIFRRRWCLSLWGELILHELHDIAIEHEAPAGLRRARVREALRVAEGGCPS